MDQAILALITAVLGGFIGAFINSHADRQGRLFDRRSVVFGDFMAKLNDALDSLHKIVMDAAIEGYTIKSNEWSIKVWEYFQPVFSKERVARLFLIERDRDAVNNAFIQAYEQIRDARLDKLPIGLYPYKYIHEIERIFLSNLEPEPFYTSFFRKLDTFIEKCKTKIRSR